MAKPVVWLLQCGELSWYGLWGKANDQTISKDISSLAAAYHKITRTKKGEVLPFIVLTRNYNAQSGDAELFIGGEKRSEGLEKLILPQGEYAKITVAPKFIFMWGLYAGKAKRFFYTQWLPKSPYESKNLEYELHTDESLGKKPTIDVFFAIKGR